MVSLFKEIFFLLYRRKNCVIYTDTSTSKQPKVLKIRLIELQSLLYAISSIPERTPRGGK